MLNHHLQLRSKIRFIIIKVDVIIVVVNEKG